MLKVIKSISTNEFHDFRRAKSTESNPLKLYSYFIDVITVVGQVDD